MTLAGILTTSHLQRNTPGYGGTPAWGDHIRKQQSPCNPSSLAHHLLVSWESISAVSPLWAFCVAAICTTYAPLLAARSLRELRLQTWGFYNEWERLRVHLPETPSTVSPHFTGFNQTWENLTFQLIRPPALTEQSVLALHQKKQTRTPSPGIATRSSEWALDSKNNSETKL